MHLFRWSSRISKETTLRSKTNDVCTRRDFTGTHSNLMQKLIIFLLLFVQQKRRFDDRIVIGSVVIQIFEYRRIQ